MSKRKPHAFGRFDLRRVRVSGWALPMSRDPQVTWQERDGEGDDDERRHRPDREWPMCSRRQTRK